VISAHAGNARTTEYDDTSMQLTRPTFRTHISALALALVVIIIASPAQSQRTKTSLAARQQRNSEKGLHDNRYFFYFINATITNMGTEEEKNLFTEAIRRDMIAQLLYMKFLFAESWDEILKSQKILIDLYQKTLNRDISEANKLLNSFAPGVVRADRFLPRHYLRLGYRDAEDARIDLVMADNFQEHLYSMRLYRYSKAIKKVKHGKRYALLAMLETKTPDFYETLQKEMAHEEIELIRKQKELVRKEKDLARKEIVLSRELDTTDEERLFKKMKERIIEASNGADRDYHVLVHIDNYYKSKEPQSLFDMVWENPELEKIPEYESYLKLQ
jgi:hypothetical protein